MAQSDDYSGATQSLKDSAAQLTEQQKKAGAHQLSGIAGAVHAAADQLGEQLPGAAGYIHDAAKNSTHHRKFTPEYHPLLGSGLDRGFRR